MDSTLISDERRLGAGLKPVAVGGAVQSFLARPSIIDTYYSENLLTLAGSILPAGTETGPVGWSWPWPPWPWGPDKEDQESEELPKGSEPSPVIPPLAQPIPLTNFLFLGGIAFLSLWFLRKR